MTEATRPGDGSTRSIEIPRRVYRHRVPTRLWHWLNLICLCFLLASGLQIFNAYPRLHWGRAGDNATPAAVEMVAERAANGQVRGVTRISGVAFDTTGVLGVSKVRGELYARGFPAWATLPAEQNLALGRRIHLAFAWIFMAAGAAFALWAVISRHLTRDLLPERAELAPRSLASDIWAHARLKVPRGEEALHYNPLQKLAYLLVIYGLLPLMVLTGLTMMPGMNAAWPWLLELFGGRQSARTIHFISASLILLFVAVHLFEVMLVGPIASIRSMITGWWRVKP